MPSVRSDFVEVIVFRKRGRRLQFLLLKRSETESPYPGMWQVVSGRRREGERTVAAALREVREETGCHPWRVWTLPFVNVLYSADRDSVQNAPTFAVEVLPEETVRTSEEHTAHRWVTLSSARTLAEWPAHLTMMNLVRDFIMQNRGWARHTRIV